MDPLSQAVTGAALAGLFSRKPKLRPALLLGALGGMAADLDIFIRSDTDPLLALEYHRHFTHSIFFAPIGGLICAAALWLVPWVKNRVSFMQSYAYCFLGYATHGLLDACTSYGTRLYWPFSDTRVSWDSIGIIDLFFTLPVLILLITASVKYSRRCVVIASVWGMAYLGLGFAQHHRAVALTEAWLAAQNIPHEQLALRPTIGNLWLWRIVYKDTTQNRWQAHALRLPFWGESATYKPGETAAIFDDKMLTKYPEDTTTGNDIRRFAFFSNDYLSYHPLPEGGFYIGDMRYAISPDSAKPLWGIQPGDDFNQHITRLNGINRRVDWDYTWKLLKGEGFTPLRP